MAQNWRTVRVFISSTFRDMHEEREELVKRVFPQLRKLCEQRGVTWGEVDLRWGITDEQKADGKVLPICIDEIQRCRPYFIGLLGEYYGWVPDKIPEELVERQPWLAEHQSHSVTELEIIHGVLINPKMAGHAYFYLRDPAYIDSLPEDDWSLYIEVPTKEDIKKYGLEEAERRAEIRKQKLEALKERIIKSGLPVRTNYADPKELGELVLRDMTGVIDRLYPEESIPDPLEREAAEHQAFAESRHGLYIGKKGYIERINHHVQGDEPPLVVLGESGSGKSALLANWALKHQEHHADDEMILHFIGASPYSADWKAMLTRIMGEFIRRFNIQLKIPDQPDALRTAFANSLHKVAAQGRVVLILDGLNQLEDCDQALDLVWLPPKIPANVRLLLSTLPGRPLEELVNRGWPTMKVELLNIEERKKLIAEYLKRYAKTLSSDHLNRIASATQTANPLYLRALLEELRIYGDHFALGSRIDHYLASPTPDKLYEKILERYEQDYEHERPGLVADTMKWLWAARRGLSEVELMEMLGSNGEPLPRAYLSPLYLAAEQALVNRSGLIGFFHDYMRRAIENKYLSGDKDREVAHLRLARYFEDRDLGMRKIDELPWQLSQAKSWQRLFDLLAERRFFAAAWRMNLNDVRAFWSEVETNSHLELIDAYRSVIESLGDDINYISQVAGLLDLRGHLHEALGLWNSLVSHFRQTGDIRHLAISLGRQAVILDNLGDLDTALKRQKESEAICRQLGLKSELAASLGNQGLILAKQDDLDEALMLHREQEQISRDIDDKNELANSLGSQGTIYLSLGNLDEAMSLLRQQEHVCREVGDKDGLITSLGNEAQILHARGDLEGSIALLRQVEQICRELGNRYKLCQTLGNLAIVLQDHGDLDEAMALCREEEQMSREFGWKEQLANSIAGKIKVLLTRSQPDMIEIMSLTKQMEQIYRELDNKDDLQKCLDIEASILFNSGDFAEALMLYKETEQICRETGDPEGLITSLYNQTIITAMKFNRPREALPLINKAYEVSTQYGLADSEKKVKRLLERIRKSLEES